MGRFSSVRFALQATALALMVGVACALAVPGAADRGWALAGWLATTAVGLGGGLWMSATYGRDGSGFVLALGACMLLRLALVVGGVILTRVVRPEALVPLLVGLAVGYVPLQFFESIWFARRSRADRASASAPPGGHPTLVGGGRAAVTGPGR